MNNHKKEELPSDLNSESSVDYYVTTVNEQTSNGSGIYFAYSTYLIKIKKAFQTRFICLKKWEENCGTNNNQIFKINWKSCLK